MPTDTELIQRWREAIAELEKGRDGRGHLDPAFAFHGTHAATIQHYKGLIERLKPSVL